MALNPASLLNQWFPNCNTRIQVQQVVLKKSKLHFPNSSVTAY